MEIKVGDYVRTKSGFIDKIININDFREPSMKYALEQPSWNDDIVFIGEEDIIKSSPNIIDLIEVEDYVNGQKVFDKLYDELNKCWYLKLEIGEVFGKYARTYQQHIKSIVTKEQFSQIEYSLESQV